MLKKLDSLPLSAIYRPFPVWALFLAVIGVYDIYAYGIAGISLIGAVCKLSLALDLAYLAYSGPNKASRIVHYSAAAFASISLLCTIIDLVLSAGSITSSTVIIALVIILLSGPMVPIMLRVADREARGGDEALPSNYDSAGLAAPLHATPIAEASYA